MISLNFNNTSSKNLDAGFGVEFTNKKPKKLLWKTGLALHHYYQKQTVLENGEDALPTLAQLYFQGQKSNGFMMYRYYSLVQIQSLAALSGTIGMDASYRFNYDSKYTNFSTSSAITAGLFYRYRDAVIALVGYEHKRQFRISVSYDVNISNLERAVSEKIGLNVVIKNSQRNTGSITFAYKEIDQLNKIIEIIKTYY